MFRVNDSLSRVALWLSLAACAAAVSCAAKRPPVQHEERPPFYDESNHAEYYGRCPQCNEWVKGYYGIAHYGDAQGYPAGSVGAYIGRCEYCGANVMTEDIVPPLTPRIVQWQVYEVQGAPVP